MKDENGRYWVALGPKVMDPNYPDDGSIDSGTEPVSDWYGKEADVVLESVFKGKKVLK